LAKFANDTYINSSFFNQAIVYEFVRRGWLDENLVSLKDLYRTRLDAMLSALASNFADIATWPKPDGGFFVGMTLNAHIRPEDLFQRAKEAHLELTDGRGFFCSGGERFIRLPFCALTPEEIQTGVSRLNEVVRSLL
jgi:2-aminoadipate transaminase